MSNLNERIEKLEKELAQLKEEANNEWPKKGDRYWFVGAEGDTYVCTWENDSTDFDCKSIGNVYHTEEEAKHRVEQLKLIQELREFGGDEGEYFLWHRKKVGWDWGIGYSGLVQFPSEEKALEAIKHFGDRLNIL